MPSKFGNTLSAAIGVACVGSFAMMHFADASPAFQATDIVSHRTLDSASEGACGGGNCGAAMMDKNKDGKVSRAEALRYGFTDAQISNADRNGDGELDPAEVAAMKKAGKGVEGSGATHT